jgi:predicted phage terminase large subunit-like protein
MQSLAREMKNEIPLKSAGNSVTDLLNRISYAPDPSYIPGDFALEFVNFIKLVNGAKGEENKTPVLHYRMLDQIAGKTQSIVNMLFRGSGKTAVFSEYLFLYLGVYGSLPGFGPVPLALYVSDSIENGVKNLRRNLEHRWADSEFLQKYIPEIRFTDIRWEFINVEGKSFVAKGYGATTGVRGSKEKGQRPVLAVLDDLISDDDARSATVISRIEDTVYKAIDYALHPTRHKTIWSGTPFNSRDPLYKAVESGAWKVNVFPVCEKFPCKRSEFRGAWEDRFSYDAVLEKYTKALNAGKIETFNQELMLKIMSEEDRLIQDCDIGWYKRASVLNNKGLFNFYITTDFATSSKSSADFSVISVWAYNNNGDWLWVDGIVEKQTMDRNINALFRLAQVYKPQEVGVEVSGQQKGFVSWIREQMLVRNVYFTLASENQNGDPGIRPVTDKMQRFQTMVPLFKTNKILFPEERRSSPEMIEAMDELTLISKAGFKSKHDDFLDTISMLGSLRPWKPSQTGDLTQKDDSGLWDIEQEEETNNLASYIV